MTFPTFIRFGFFWAVALLFIVWIGCEEKPPFTIDTDGSGVDTSQNNNNIPFIDKDTIFIDAVATPQSHIVLIEEFTGVNCVNCPAGHDVTKNILEANPNRTVAAIIHAGFLTDPHPNSTQVFTSPKTEALYNLLLVEAVPSAAIDRVLFADEPRLAITNKSQWGGRVVERLSATTPVNVYLHKQYDPATRQVKVFVQLRYTETITDVHHITVYLTENNILDSQLLPDPTTGQNTVQDDYVHQHVVRDVLTATAGDPVQPSPPQNSGLVIVKTFTTSLPDTWNVDNCHIVAAVHQSTGNGNVLQAAEIAVAE